MYPQFDSTLVDLEHARILRQTAEFERRLRSLAEPRPESSSRFSSIRAAVARETDDQHLSERAEFRGFSCSAERTLTGRLDHAETLQLARILERRSEQAGSERAVAFARTLAGEAALLAGYLRHAETALSEGIELHHAQGSLDGEAHALHLLAQLRFATGDVEASHRLLVHALPLAHSSRAARHLVPRVYGSMIATTLDADEAAELATTAASVIRVDSCAFCRLAYELPALIARADSGDIEGAREHEQRVWDASRIWIGTTVEAQVSEALAHLAAASGDDPQLNLQAAIAAYDSAGQPLDVKRCVALRHELSTAA